MMEDTKKDFFTINGENLLKKVKELIAEKLPSTKSRERN